MADGVVEPTTDPNGGPPAGPDGVVEPGVELGGGTGGPDDEPPGGLGGIASDDGVGPVRTARLYERALAESWDIPGDLRATVVHRLGDIVRTSPSNRAVTAASRALLMASRVSVAAVAVALKAREQDELAARVDDLERRAGGADVSARSLKARVADLERRTPAEPDFKPWVILDQHVALLPDGRTADVADPEAFMESNRGAYGFVVVARPARDPTALEPGADPNPAPTDSHL